MAEVNTDINELRWLDIVFWFPCIVYLEAKQLELYFADRHHILPRNQDNITVLICPFNSLTTHQRCTIEIYQVLNFLIFSSKLHTFFIQTCIKHPLIKTMV